LTLKTINNVAYNCGRSGLAAEGTESGENSTGFGDKGTGFGDKGTGFGDTGTACMMRTSRIKRR
jgi:hypothetical protein